MRLFWWAVFLCAVIVVALVAGAIAGYRSAGLPSPGAGPKELDVNLSHPVLPPMNLTMGEKTAIFSKYVGAGTQSLIVSLYSGDRSDPLSVTIITPDKTLGPFYDSSDGKADGRIDLKITIPDTTPGGYWKFLIHSRKEITSGSLENLSWVRPAPDHKPDE